MKKVLAVLLAVVLCFSVSVTAFAADLVAEPTPTSGEISISVQSAYVEAGQTYQLPVSIISDYSTSDVIGDVALCLAFNFGISCKDAKMQSKVEITDFQFTDEIKGIDGFVLADAFGSDFDPTAVSALIPGDELLQTDRTVIGYVTIKVAEDIEFTETDDVENPIMITVTPVMWGTASNAIYEMPYYAEYTGKFAMSLDSIIACTSCAVVDTYGTVEDVGEFFISYSGYCYQLPPVLPWTERILNLLKLWGYQIVTAITSLLQVAQSFLKPAA